MAKVKSTTPHEETAVTAANSKGLLSQLARKITRVALDKKLLEMLKNKRVGTRGIEIQSLEILKGNQKYEGVNDGGGGKKKKKMAQ